MTEHEIPEKECSFRDYEIPEVPFHIKVRDTLINYFNNSNKETKEMYVELFEENKDGLFNKDICIIDKNHYGAAISLINGYIMELGGEGITIVFDDDNKLVKFE